jgi:hypothetical protein
MNTKSLLTRIGVPVLSLGLLGGIGATLATSASAATLPGAVHAVTHSPGHLDTTVGPVPVAAGSALKDSPGGPVWAYDNLSEQFTVVPDGANYKVTIDVTGSFQGFADPGRDGLTTDPNYGQPLASSGPVHGTITYEVQSSQAPDPKALPANEPDGTGLGVALNQLFGQTDGSSIFADNVGPQVVGGGNDYVFSYQNGNYVQDGSGIHGDVTGH